MKVMIGLVPKKKWNRARVDAKIRKLQTTAALDLIRVGKLKLLSPEEVERYAAERGERVASRKRLEEARFRCVGAA